MHPRSHDSYRVAWICPLEVEQIAALEMLDKEHKRLPQPSGDTNVYNLGSINNHNVVIVGLPQAGNCPAATVVTQMRRTFPNLKYGLLVGIGGGVPVKTDCGMIRLGHVVVSEPTGTHSGAIQYDHGKANEGYFERTGILAPPPLALLNAARELSISRQRMDNDLVSENVKRIQTSRRTLRRFKSPGAANDHLYVADYKHKQKGVPCGDCGCDENQRIRRPINEEDDLFVVVHRGTIATGEKVIKNAKRRDALAKSYTVLCFETEAAGVLNDFPCMVIRGISDYCDSHKSDEWQGYAAAVAAAYARQLFFHMSEEAQRPTAFELQYSLSAVSGVSHFVARKYELQLVQEALEGFERCTAVVHGLGGMGKTQLAIAYIKRHRLDYSAAIWMNARDETGLKQSFADAAEWILRHHPTITYLADALQSRDLDEIVKAVKMWLDEPMNDRWLVIYDNYDNPLLDNHRDKSLNHASCIKAGAGPCGDEGRHLTNAFDLRAFLPEADHGDVIVTTRSSMVNLRQPIKSIHLSKLEDINDSLEILESVSGRDGLSLDPAAVKLAEEFDGLPLALATAGAYLNQVSVTYTEYLQLYRESWRQLQEETPLLQVYDQKLYSTWNVSYQFIQQQSPIAALLLQQWAYFANEDLWYELLGESGPEKPEWLEKLTENKLTFHTTLRLLCSHGLVEADQSTPEPVDSGGYNVHRCVHSWMMYVLNEVVDRDMALTAIKCVVARVPNDSEPKFWQVQRRLIAHADRCLEVLDSIDVGNEAEGLHSLGLLYADQGRLQEAEKMYQRALEGKEKAKALGRWHPSTLDTVNNLGIIYADQDRLQEAEAMYMRALEGYEKVRWQGHPSTLHTLNNLGNLYKNQGRLQEAETMYERALEGKEKAKAWGYWHPSTLDTVNNLGLLYADQGRHQKAEEMYERALKGKEKALERWHPSTLDTVNNLGNLYKNQGRLREAETMYVRALKGYEKTWGRCHPSTLDALNNLGNLYKNQSRLQEAEEMYKQALEGKEKAKALGGEHTSTLDTVNNLGNLYRNQGRLREAETMYVRALKGYEKTWGRWHPSTLGTVNNLGNLYAEQGRFQDAETMYVRALEGYKKTLGPTSLLTYIPALVALENLGLLSEKQGTIEKALLYYQQALDGAEAHIELSVA
ncbi:hypothetical protein N7460_003297 [Penicillium canescens]|uniref:Uncharacterized protein n=1 Tax=Penicillium canescens TaxID=5083 RepID=A0AAD6IM24_PENCN|nr:hypothetical protein N7460_003297 [Penicillium canescens]